MTTINDTYEDQEHMAYFQVIPGYLLRAARKTAKNTRQNNLCTDRGQNRVLTAYEVTTPQISKKPVQTLIVIRGCIQKLPD